ncbi:MAG: hypothetical protein HY879_26575 [Deltaproteobacteria bacterium]|nr:hypothetical protein [Deltaproteobacteria bacterium]
MRTSLRKRAFILVSLLVVMVIFIALKSEIQAAENWYTAAVVSAGPGWGSAYICLTATNGAFTNKYMICRTDQPKEQLAMAVTAMALGKYVMAYLDPALATPTIQAMYVIN